MKVTTRGIDRGPFSGARTVDVTMAVAQALGYRDCWAWGERTIRMGVVR